MSSAEFVQTVVKVKAPYTMIQNEILNHVNCFFSTMGNTFRKFTLSSWVCVTLALLAISRRTTQMSRYTTYSKHLKGVPKTFRGPKQSVLRGNDVEYLRHNTGNQGQKYFSNITKKSHALSANKQQHSRVKTGRHLLANDQNRMLYEAQLIANISEKVLNYCSYANFCFTNSSVHWDRRPNRKSCCEECYCDENCGKRMDCCFDFLDKHKIAESNNPVVPIGYPNDTFIHSYLMVDKCLGNESNHCTSESVAVWRSFFPVYSPSKAMIYFNRYCAGCNNITDAINWNLFASCAQRYSFNGLEFLEGVKDGKCQIQFAPPREAKVDRFICYPAVIDSCYGVEYGTENGIMTREACEIINVPVKQYANSDVYANIFCKLCNGIEHDPSDSCQSFDNGPTGVKSPDSVNSFAALID